MKSRLEEYIAEWAERTPEKVAVVSEGRETTYAELWRAVLNKKEELREKVTAGHAVVVRSTQNVDYLIEYFALHTLDAVVCPLDKDATDEKLAAVREEVGSLEFRAGIDADILYTTGTTGKSKGALYTHRGILCCGNGTAEALGFTSQTVFITTGPLNHSGCWAKVFPVMMTGATLYILEGMKDLNAFFEALNYSHPSSNQKTACFIAPASIRMLMLMWKKNFLALQDKIDFIETGGAPLATADMQGLAEVLPKTRLYNSLGSTEGGIVCTYNYNDGRYKNSCVGRPTKYTDIKIIDGKITIKNEGAMEGYVGAPELTAQVMRDGRIYTNDLGHIDEDGMLIIEGRDGDVINVGGMKVAPTEVEDVVLTYSGIADCICLPQPHAVMGNVVKLLVKLKDDVSAESFDKRGLARYIASKLEAFKVPQNIEVVEKINRTYNGKLDRKSYLK